MESGVAGTMRKLLLASIYVAAAGGTLPAAAVIVYGPQGRNTTLTPDSEAFDPSQYQGRLGGFLGTAIGPNLILMAKHVGIGPGQQFFYQGQLYQTDTTFGNGAGMVFDPDTDLAVLRITGTFPSYAKLYTSTDDIDGEKRAIVFGQGTTRGEEVLVNGARKGWKWGVHDGALSWGENRVGGAIDAGPQVGSVLWFDFKQSDGQVNANEAHLSAGDSSGGVFIKVGDDWRLAGVNYAADAEYSHDGTDSTAFLGALYNTSGVFERNYETSPPTWQAGQGPSYWFATRISTNLDFLYQFAPAPPVNQPNFFVTAHDNVGAVDVAGTVSVGGSAELRADSIRAGVLDIAPGGQVAIKPVAAGASRVGTLLLGAGATLDLADSALAVAAASEQEQAMVLAQVSDWIESARNDGPALWQGSGITTSSAGTSQAYTLGVRPNRDDVGQPLHAAFEGVAVDASAVLVKYTLAGDLNLDGSIDAFDYFLIDRGRALRRAGYWNGDVDYSGGFASADDFMRMDRNFIGQTATPVVAPVGSVVPEPMGFAALALPLILLRRRRPSR